jgi:hypothetical protein
MRIPVASLDAPPVRWVPIASLPRELRASIDEVGALEPMDGPLNAFWRMSPTVLVAASLTLAYILLARVLPLPLGAAVLTAARVALVLVTVSLLSFAYLWRRWRRADSVTGKARPAVYLAPTALVVVDAHALAVLPAEHVERRDGAYWYRDLQLTDRAHDPSWAPRFEDVASRARFDDQARRDDPWRALPEAPAFTSLAAARRRPVVLGALGVLGVGLVIASAVELVPGYLAAKERAAFEAAARRTRELQRQEEEVAEREARRLAEERERVLRAQRGRLGELIDRIDRLSEPEAHELLASERVTPTMKERVCHRLQSLCEARFPMRGVAPGAAIFRAAQQARCADGHGRVWYEGEATLRGGYSPEAQAETRTALEAGTGRWLADHLRREFHALGDDEPVRVEFRLWRGAVGECPVPHLVYNVEVRPRWSATPRPGAGTLPDFAEAHETILLVARDGALSGFAPYARDFRAELREDPPEGVGLPMPLIDAILASVATRR